MEAWVSEIPLVVWLAGFLALYMAWGIGANDVANAMGTSVGSGALTLGGAVLVAGVLEFSGAFLAGGHVTDTVRNLVAGKPYLSSDHGSHDLKGFEELARLFQVGWVDGQE